MIFPVREGNQWFEDQSLPHREDFIHFRLFPYGILFIDDLWFSSYGEFLVHAIVLIIPDRRLYLSPSSQFPGLAGYLQFFI